MQFIKPYSTLAVGIAIGYLLLPMLLKTVRRSPTA